MDDPKTGPKTGAGAADAQALAQRFLDVWQEQAGLLATDPKLAELSASWLNLWKQGAAAATQATAPGAQGGGNDARPGAKAGSAKTGAAPAAAASGDGQPDVAELARRLADCEARLAALESRTEGPVRRPGAGPGKRRSK
jgi:hypothetical protein